MPLRAGGVDPLGCVDNRCSENGCPKCLSGEARFGAAGATALQIVKCEQNVRGYLATRITAPRP